MERPHEAHRERMRQRFSANGLEGMAEHEVLELMLYYAIPFKDTNPIAHELIDRFGSLNQVLKTDPEYLKEVKGVGSGVALYLSFLKHFIEYYEAHELSSRCSLARHSDAEEFVRRQLRYLEREQVLLLCVDSRMFLIRSDVLAKGTVNETPVSIRKVMEHAMKFHAVGVILAHNHPSGTAEPTREDNGLTQRLYEAFGHVGIRLLDHIIVAGEDCYSYHASGKLNDIETAYRAAFGSMGQHPARFVD